MERKQLDVPIKDFDSNGYDEVEFISKDEIVIENISEEEVALIEEKELELDLSIAVGSQLLDYFMKRFKDAHGYEYVSDRVRDSVTLDGFRDRYGLDAGPMIKILFDKHNGKLSKADGVITVTAFSRGAKWLQDMLYFDLQEEKKKQVFKNSNEGLMTSNEFRKIFRVAK
jgi:hypothetical protein